MVQEGGRFGEVRSHTAGGEIISVLQFRFISFHLTQIAGQHPGIQSIKLSIPAAFCSRTGNKVWGNQTNCWLWAKCSSLTLQTIYFSRRKLPTLLRNTVLQWLALKVTPGLRISGYFSWCLNGWLDGIPPREMVRTFSPPKSCVAWRMSRLWVLSTDRTVAEPFFSRRTECHWPSAAYTSGMFLSTFPATPASDM